MTEAERLTRANAASAELHVTESLFDAMRSSAIERWASTSLDQTATREKLFLVVQTIDAVRRALQAAVQDGEVVRHGREMAELLAPAAGDRG